MVFSFFRKQAQKMPERPAARPRSPDWPDSAAPASQPPESLPPEETPAAPPDFDFGAADVSGIAVEHGEDPRQADIEQVVVLFANGQDAMARSLLEDYVRSYPPAQSRPFWELLFDLLQVQGDREGFERLGVDYAHACETSPPTWRDAAPAAAGSAPRRRLLALPGVLTADAAGLLDELDALLGAGSPLDLDCGRLAGCDDAVAGRLADALLKARRAGVAVRLLQADAFLGRLNERLVAGQAEHEPAWRLLLELLQRHGTQALFEERAVDFAVTFEVSPPSWEAPPAAAPAEPGPAGRDDAHYLAGELKNCRFDELAGVLNASAEPVLDFSGVRRLDFYSAGQLVNRIAPCQAAGKTVVIRHPNRLVAELMAVVGLDRLARIILPKS